MTDLEEQVRATLAAVGGQAPGATGLAAGARRRQRMRWVYIAHADKAAAQALLDGIR